MVRRGRKAKRTGKLCWRDIRAVFVGIACWFWRLLCLVRYLNPLFHLAPRHRQFYAPSTDGSGLIKPSLCERVINTFQNDETTRVRLLEWCQLQIPTCTVSNLSTCWQDGIALCALMESTCPGVCPRYDLLKPQHKVNNCRLGLKLANKHLCIPLAIITPEDIALSHSETKMRRLLSLIKWASQRKNTPYKKHKTRFQNESNQAPAAMRTSAKGSGLVAGVVNKLCKFNVSTPPKESLQLQIEISGPQGYACDELITSRINRITGNALVQAAAMEWKKKPYTKSVTKAAKLFKSLLKAKGDAQDVQQGEADESEDNKKIPFDYQCVGECQIAISFIPRSAGKHVINILWHGKHVRGSPFSPTIEESVEKLNDNASGKVKQKKLPIGKQGRLQYYPNESFPSMDDGDEMSSDEIQASANLRRFAAANNIQYRLTKQATITRRRVLKKVMTRAGKEIVIHEATDTSRENSQDSLSRQESIENNTDVTLSALKTIKLERVAQIVEQMRLSPRRRIDENSVNGEDHRSMTPTRSEGPFSQLTAKAQGDTAGDITDKESEKTPHQKEKLQQIVESLVIPKSNKENQQLVQNAIGLKDEAQLYELDTGIKHMNKSSITKFAGDIVDKVFSNAFEIISRSNTDLVDNKMSDDSIDCPSATFRPVMQAPSQLDVIDIHRPIVNKRPSTENTNYTQISRSTNGLPVSNTCIKPEAKRYCEQIENDNSCKNGAIIDNSKSLTEIEVETSGNYKSQTFESNSSNDGNMAATWSSTRQRSTAYKGGPIVDSPKDEAMSLRLLQSGSLNKSCYFMTQHPPILQSSSSSQSAYSTMDSDMDTMKTVKNNAGPDYFTAPLIHQRVPLAQQKPKDKLRQSLSLPTLSRKWKAFEIDSDEEDAFTVEEMRTLAAHNKQKRYTLGSSDLSETLEQFNLLRKSSSGEDASKNTNIEQKHKDNEVTDKGNNTRANRGGNGSPTVSRPGSCSDMVFGKHVISLQKVSEEDSDKTENSEERHISKSIDVIDDMPVVVIPVPRKPLGSNTDTTTKLVKRKIVKKESKDFSSQVNANEIKDETGWTSPLTYVRRRHRTVKKEEIQAPSNNMEQLNVSKQLDHEQRNQPLCQINQNKDRNAPMVRQTTMDSAFDSGITDDSNGYYNKGPVLSIEMQEPSRLLQLSSSSSPASTVSLASENKESPVYINGHKAVTRRTYHRKLPLDPKLTRVDSSNTSQDEDKENSPNYNIERDTINKVQNSRSNADMRKSKRRMPSREFSYSGSDCEVKPVKHKQGKANKLRCGSTKRRVLFSRRLMVYRRSSSKSSTARLSGSGSRDSKDLSLSLSTEQAPRKSDTSFSKSSDKSSYKPHSSSTQGMMTKRKGPPRWNSLTSRGSHDTSEDFNLSKDVFTPFDSIVQSLPSQSLRDDGKTTLSNKNELPLPSEGDNSIERRGNHMATIPSTSTEESYIGFGMSPDTRKQLLCDLNTFTGITDRQIEPVDVTSLDPILPDGDLVGRRQSTNSSVADWIRRNQNVPISFEKDTDMLLIPGEFTTSKDLKRHSDDQSQDSQQYDSVSVARLTDFNTSADEQNGEAVPKPERCYAFGPGLYHGDVGVKNSFQVRVCDAGNGCLTAGVHGPHPHSVNETNITYTGDNLYDVIYEVTRPGYYIITVKWSEINIPNSPFICKVTY